MRVKAITLHQPWAWAVIHGPKRVENRPWRIYHRGWLAVHAGRLDECRVGGDITLPDGSVVRDDQLVFSALIGLVQVVGCVEPRDLPGDPFAVGPWCHKYAEPRPLVKPFPCRGHQGLWDVDIPDEYLTGPPAMITTAYSGSTISRHDLSEAQCQILRRMSDEEAGDELYPIFDHRENGHSYELAEIRWASDFPSPDLADVKALLEADLIELDWEDDEDDGRLWHFRLSESGEEVAESMEP